MSGRDFSSAPLASRHGRPFSARLVLNAIVGILLLFAARPTAAQTPQDATLLPVADTYATSSPYADSNWGSITFVAVRNSATAFSAVSYLKFDLTNVTVAPASALLKLTTDSVYTGPANTNMTVQVYTISDTTWTEGGLTWNNAPGLNTTTGASTGTIVKSVNFVLQENTAFSIDLTAFVAAHLGQIVTLQLANPNQDGNLLDINSKEASSGRIGLALSFPPASLLTLTVNPLNVLGGAAASGTVTLTTAAPLGGALVTLSETGPATVPPFVRVPAGQTSVDFLVASNPVSASSSPPPMPPSSPAPIRIPTTAARVCSSLPTRDRLEA